MINNEDLKTRESFNDAIINSLFYFNIKEFGAVGDGTADDTEAIQKAIDSCFRDNGRHGGTIIIPYGTYKITKTLNLKCLGVVLHGESTQGTVLKIDENFDGDSLINIFSSETENLGKIVIENLKLDATNNDNEIHGIKFMPIIYNNVFRNLDFESFTGSWFYSNNPNNKISEGIKWTDITGNARNKVYTSSPFKLSRINESLIINCTIFGKQYHSYPYSTLPLVDVEVPQQLNFLSNNFSNVNAPAIKIKSDTGAQIQGIWIQGCHFEDIDSEDKEKTLVIELLGDEINKSEYGFIGPNRYLEISNPTIKVDNAICLEINDNKPSIVLESGAVACIVKKTTDNNSTITNNGINNVINEYTNGGVKVIGNNPNKYIYIDGNYSYIKMCVDNNEEFTIKGEKSNLKLVDVKFEHNGEYIGGFNNYGINFKAVNGIPSDTYYIPDGTVYIDTSNNTLCFKINGATKRINFS